MDIEGFKEVKGKLFPLKQVYLGVVDSKVDCFMADQSGELIAFADYYGRKGSGRSVLFDSVYLKGIGATGIVKDNSKFKATGQLAMSEAINEAIFLSIIHFEFNDSVELLGLMETDESVCLHPMMDTVEFDKLIPRKQYSRGAVLSRSYPVRIAHLRTALKEEILSVANSNENYSTRDHIYGILENIAKRAGFWWVRRVDFGAVMSDNIDVRGNVFDLATATIKPDYRNTYVCSHKHLFWDYVSAYSPEIPNEIIEGLGEEFIFENTPAITFLERRLKHWHKFYLLDLLGFTDEDKFSLELQAPELFESIASEIDLILRVGTDVKSDDPYDGHVELINKKLVGLNWREELSRVVMGRPFFDKAFERLSTLFPQVFKYIGWKKVWVENQRVIHMDISGSFRACEANELALYEAIESGRIEKYIDDHVNLYKTTLGTYQK